MFGPLMDFQDNDYLKEHSIVTFDTMYRPGTYKIFASFQSKAYDPDSEEFKYYDFINAETAYDFEEYLNNIKNLSLYYDEENAPSFGDEIITLSHSARSKEIFAVGAVNAAVYVAGKPAGLYDMSELIK